MNEMQSRYRGANAGRRYAPITHGSQRAPGNTDGGEVPAAAYSAGGMAPPQDPHAAAHLPHVYAQAPGVQQVMGALPPHVPVYGLDKGSTFDAGWPMPAQKHVGAPQYPYSPAHSSSAPYTEYSERSYALPSAAQSSHFVPQKTRSWMFFALLSFFVFIFFASAMLGFVPVSEHTAESQRHEASGSSSASPSSQTVSYNPMEDHKMGRLPVTPPVDMQHEASVHSDETSASQAQAERVTENFERTPSRGERERVARESVPTAPSGELSGSAGGFDALTWRDRTVSNRESPDEPRQNEQQRQQQEQNDQLQQETVARPAQEETRASVLSSPSAPTGGAPPGVDVKTYNAMVAKVGFFSTFEVTRDPIFRAPSVSLQQKLQGRALVPVGAIDGEMIRKQRFAERIIVSEKNKMVYCPVPKAANSTWKVLIRKHEGFADYKSLQVANMKSANGLTYLKDFSAERIEEILTDPSWFRFLVGREPFTRHLSAYLNKFMNKPTISEEYHNYYRQLMHFGLSAKEITERPRPTFAEYTAEIRRKNPEYHNEHWAPQYYICGMSLVPYDFVGKLEQIDQDSQIVFEALGWHGESFPSQKEVGFLSSGTKSKKAEYYSKHAVLIDDLLQKFARDFELLQYSTEWSFDA
ncbi:Carbohydrate sulfotransferase 14 [Porphyridium purpureum]|uniref:Carbohydrate sulfotransferase 14 n=1 Tax=Porphyridium purpureum TaxID=35688 RepID=A0A5J4YHD8_PORPP|nr:Carbohydrate sulfotransferase 14 [Porphyridium purpureum]|eukprot:POR9210..scf251_18